VPGFAKRAFYRSNPGYFVCILVGLAVAVVAASYLFGDGWNDLGVAMTLYAAALTIMIFGWTLRDTVRLHRDEVDVARVTVFLDELGVQKYSHRELNSGQLNALAEVVGRPTTMVSKQIQLCLSPDTPAKRHRIVLLSDGSIWQITIGGAGGGYNVQTLLRVAVPEK
jgi:low affinity Fe/Cu permease